jgi:hypothetical protein
VASSGIPDDVAEFIADHIDSVELLEVLLLLRERSGEVWTDESVARELRINPVSTAARLKALAARGLLSSTDAVAFRYAPATTSLDTTVRRVAECYKERRVSVITAIFSRPNEHVRIFADAFRIRKEE